MQSVGFRMIWAWAMLANKSGYLRVSQWGAAQTFKHDEKSWINMPQQKQHRDIITCLCKITFLFALCNFCHHLLLLNSNLAVRERKKKPVDSSLFSSRAHQTAQLEDFFKKQPWIIKSSVSATCPILPELITHSQNSFVLRWIWVALFSCVWAVGTELLHWVWQPSHNIVQGRSLSFPCWLNVIWQMDSICRESGGLTLPLTIFFFFFGRLLPVPQTFQGGEICIKLTRSNRASELSALVFSAIRALLF